MILKLHEELQVIRDLLDKIALEEMGKGNDLFAAAHLKSSEHIEELQKVQIAIKQKNLKVINIFIND